MCKIADGIGDLHELKIHGGETAVMSALFHRWIIYAYFHAVCQAVAALIYTQKMKFRTFYTLLERRS